ncbi:uncharacterized protein N0V89_001117 [Didymosphaeria variabile]|uniref:RTA1-domain-containing protein n=1 Tax=Didymosphaeria variabile TaxID=1932322 RepID=A0A9W8XY36_9PLEO|nr:uncharacterized protein N0V89_001117 [Didymosphaeria variabile]KAJ4360552.1 hypothetical protein N0V89_001117 [Didymosphaeria variabile]
MAQTVSTTTATSAPSCTTAIPGQYGYVPPDACNAQWAYSPSFTAAIAFSTLFGILTVAHLALAICFRKGFCWVLLMGTAWETISFVIRALGAHDQQSQAYSFAATLLFLLAPLWVNAYVYMTAGRLIWAYHPDKKVWGFKAISLGKYFVWLDVFSFLVQAVGGVMLSPGGSETTMKTGKNVYMTGVGVQQLFILLFFALIVRFQIEVQRFEASGAGWLGKRWQWVTYALYAALALITMRIVFRLIEFSAGTGVDNPLPYHEKYALALDAFPMTLAILILAVIHPGLALKGPESEFPSRKERKAEKKIIKAAKKAEKHERKMAKKGGYSSVSDIEMNSV